MNCERYSEWISLYIDGELEEKACLVFEDHISNCNLCLVELNILQDIVKNIKNLEMIEPPKEFHKDLMDKIQSADIIPLAAKKNKWYLNLKIASAVAAVFIFSVILINPLKINAPKESLTEVEDNVFGARMMMGPPTESLGHSPETSQARSFGGPQAKGAVLETKEIGLEENPEIWTIETAKYKEYKEAITRISQEMGLELNTQDTIMEITLEGNKKAEFQSKIREVDETLNIMIQKESEQEDHNKVKIVIYINQLKE